MLQYRYYTLITLMCLSFTQALFAQKAPFLNGGGLPPFFASMEKHEVMVEVKFQNEDGTLVNAGADIQVGFRILAQGAKIRDYFEKTDAQGRAFFLGIPSNPKVQMSISYEVWADYEGVRFAYDAEGFPQTENKDALLEDFDSNKRLPENKLQIRISRPSKGLDGLELHHALIEFHPDEDSLLVVHEMQIYNRGKKLIDLSHQKNGGLKIPCPQGAKHPQLESNHEEDLEVRGAALYYIGALPAGAVRKVRWYYNIPYHQETFAWHQSFPIPSSVSMIVASQFKKPQHQEAIKLGLNAVKYGETKQVSTGGDRFFDTLRINHNYQANEPLEFEITHIPAPPQWKNHMLLIGSLLIIVALLLISKPNATDDTLSKEYLIRERDKLLNALARMEAGLKKGHISEVRFLKEQEAIQARLVSIYEALTMMEDKDSK